jgi:cellobiose-specific phosphotransferase system component IIC
VNKCKYLKFLRAGWIWGITLWLVGIFFVVIHFCGPEGS